MTNRITLHALRRYRSIWSRKIAAQFRPLRKRTRSKHIVLLHPYPTGLHLQSDIASAYDPTLLFLYLSYSFHPNLLYGLLLYHFGVISSFDRQPGNRSYLIFSICARSISSLFNRYSATKSWKSWSKVMIVSFSCCNATLASWSTL